MKQIKLIIVAVICFSFSSCLGQTKNNDRSAIDKQDQEVYNKLKSMNFNEYVDKATVSRFLQDVGFAYPDSTLGFSPPSYLRYISYNYSKKLWVEIQVNEFRNMSSWSSEHKWDIDNFKKETVGAIRFMYDGKCVKCTDQ